MSNTKRFVAVGLLIMAVGIVLAVRQNTAEKPAVPEPPQAEAPSASLPRLVDLGAGKCMACKMMTPVLDGLRKDFAGRLTVDFIDIWEKPDAQKQYEVRVIPTQIFFGPTGDELFRHEGFMSREDILAKWTDLGIEF